MTLLPQLSLAEIAEETGAGYNGGEILINAVSTDTRHLPPGCLFVALKGDKFDGHDYIAQALKNGAAYAVAMQAGNWPKDRVLHVSDTRGALMDIARLHRRKLYAKVVAVTGSVGKTTTKEMIACVLQAGYKTLKTEANLNNEIGLSQTILRLDESYGAAVLEMGTDGPGQMEKLSRCALPDIGVITNIGVSHLEAFGTRQGILAEKLAICAGLKDGADLILCGDNDLLSTVDAPRLNVVRYGIDDLSCPVRAGNIREFENRAAFEIIWGKGRIDAEIPVSGRHNVLNALAAFCVGLCANIPPEAAAASLKNYRPTGMRQNIVVHNSYTVVEDCYNASPDSMRAALGTFAALPCTSRRIAVLADMLELGPIAEAAHREIGEYAAALKLDVLLCTGALANNYVLGAKAAGMQNALHCESRQELLEAILETAKPGDTLWFKASHSMKLEQVITAFYEATKPE